MRPLTIEPTATVGVLANPSGECAPQLLAIEAWAGAQGLRTVDLGTTDRASELPEAGGLVIALGGDGTILRALQLALVHHTPVLGVNFGNLGFLADVDGDDLASALDRIARGEAQIDERTALVATSQTPVPQTMVAFNDLVISRHPGFGSARLHVDVSGEPVLDLVGDGLVVASPTGGCRLFSRCWPTPGVLLPRALRKTTGAALASRGHTTGMAVDVRPLDCCCVFAAYDGAAWDWFTVRLMPDRSWGVLHNRAAVIDADLRSAPSSFATRSPAASATSCTSLETILQPSDQPATAGG